MLMTITNCSLILIGAFIMLFSIIKSKRLQDSVPLIPQNLRKHITQLLNMHRLLMCFFLVGYVVVLIGSVYRSGLSNNFIVSVIFLSGAIFVFMGLAIEIHLLLEIQKTLGGLLPICSRCKQVRDPKSNGDDPQSWTDIETFISSRLNVDLTHGYCPQCYEEVMKHEGGKKD